jgi:hypothetical protein
MNDLLLVVGGFLMGFAAADIVYFIKRPVHRPRSVAEGWDQVRHVRIIDGGRK